MTASEMRDNSANLNGVAADDDDNKKSSSEKRSRNDYDKRNLLINSNNNNNAIMDGRNKSISMRTNFDDDYDDDNDLMDFGNHRVRLIFESLLAML